MRHRTRVSAARRQRRETHPARRASVSDHSVHLDDTFVAGARQQAARRRRRPRSKLDVLESTAAALGTEHEGFAAAAAGATATAGAAATRDAQ